MTEQEFDYEKIGFKSGLEIHQQLDSGKLFCNCPSVLRSDEPDFSVNRRLHAVAGESGVVDVAAQHEASIGKEFVYQGYHGNTCLVELDEEPPHIINPEALKTALQIAILLNCKILPLTQVMRKTVIDGSNTSGFQRTALIARDGYVETGQDGQGEKGRVGIKGVFLEEDSARPVVSESDREGVKVYKLDRLGVPLVEIATEPDIKNPEQAREAALHIGQILRSCKVRRGIGTIRQDVNMSVKGGERVEIKGFQDQRVMAQVINSEIKRHLDLVKKKKKIPMEVRKALPSGGTEFLRPMPGAARMYPETDLPLLRISRNMINEAKKTLPKLRHELRGELKESGLSEEMVKLLLKQDKMDEFKGLIAVLNKPNLIAKILLVFPREISKKKNLSIEKVDERLNDDVLEFVVESLRDGKISEGDIREIMERVTSGEAVEDAVKNIKADKVELGHVEEKIVKIIKAKPGLSEKAYMGLVMKEFKGKVSGKDAMEIIKRHVV